MLISVISIGKVKDRDWLNKIDEYRKRLNFDCKLQVTELKDSNVEDEGRRLIEAADKEKGYTVVLSEEGREFTSEAFAAKLEQQHRKLVFIIGGPDGLSVDVKKRADLLLSLSKMTFVHEMAKVVLFEQLYRAVSIMKGRKYHRS